MTRTRKAPAVRRQEILAAALSLAEARGYQNVTRDEIAHAAGVSGSSVQYHFRTVDQLRRELLDYAVQVEALLVIAQGLALGGLQAKGLSHDLRQRAAGALALA